MKKTNKQDNPWNAIAMSGIIGIDLAICMAGGYYLGKYIGQVTDNQPLWTIIGVTGGFVIGIIGVVFILKQFLSEDDHE